MKGQLVKELSNADRAADNGRIWAWREDNNLFLGSALIIFACRYCKVNNRDITNDLPPVYFIVNARWGQIDWYIFLEITQY